MDIITDFGSVVPGSSPGRCTRAKQKAVPYSGTAFCFSKKISLLAARVQGGAMYFAFSKSKIRVSRGREHLVDLESKTNKYT